MATKKKVVKKKVAKAKKQVVFLIPPGPQAFQAFIEAHGDFFNLTEFERQCKMASGTMRHIRAKSRVATYDHYEAVRKNVLPIMLELAVILQNYQKEFYQLPMTAPM